MPVVRRRECPTGHTYEVLVWPDGEALPQSNADPDDLSLDCPTCGAAEFTQFMTVGQGVNLNKGGPVSYPYYDETLKAWVESYAHMRRLAKERGLEPMESRNSFNRESAEERAWRKSADEGEAFLKRQSEEPWHREMMDKIGVTVRNKRGQTERVVRRDQFKEYVREKRLTRGNEDA